VNSDNSYQKNVLDNGLRVLTIPMPASRSVTVMVMVGVGSRYESASINGLSHFMEHMFFKGAETYPDAMAVASAIDAVGGSFNAFTGEEKVAYFVKLSMSKKQIAYDVLSDMILKSKFDQEEIDRERGVIVEEIRMYNDDPMSRVQMDFKLHFYGDQPIGWDIAGPEKVIHSVTRDDFLDYRSLHYASGNCALVTAGAITHDENLKLAEKFFTFTQTGEKIKADPFVQKTSIRSAHSKKEIEQAHFVLGFPIPGDSHADQPALKVLTNILGGTMSSRLFYQIRERRGLAYYIRASRQAFTDAGSLQVSAGINVDKLEEAITCVMAEIRKMKEKGITPEELERGKENIKGSFDLSIENPMAVANYYASYETLYGKVKTPEEFVAEIDSVTLEMVNTAAAAYLDPAKVKMTTLGPYESVDSFDKCLDS